MSSDDQLHLPKIDFSLLNPSTTGTEGWAATRALIVSAIETDGCFEAVYDKITPELQDALFGKGMKDLFGLPLETKSKNTSSMPYHGYIGNTPGMEYESLNVDNATERRGVEEFLALMFGDEGNPSFCDTILAFSKHLSELEQMIRRMILESLGMEKFFDRYIQSMSYALRVSKYGGCSIRRADQMTSKIAIQSHRDAAMLSIVCQHGIEGLEILTKDGKKWLTPSPNSFTVIIGEAFWAWSNGRIEPVWHRVLMKGDETRYSAIFGVLPQDGCVVEAPEELIDDDHPLKFRPYEYGEYVRFCYSDAGFKTKCALKAYCGVPNAEDDAS